MCLNGWGTVQVSKMESLGRMDAMVLGFLPGREGGMVMTMFKH